jgi:hypothetical protein
MKNSPNKFHYFRIDVDAQRDSYDAQTLLGRVLDGLVRRKLMYDNEDLLLTGVRGTRRLILERTHGDRFYTDAVPVSDLVGVERIDSITDPFCYASEASVRAPALMVYDPEFVDRGHSPDGQISKFGIRYLEVTKKDIGLAYGVGEGNLDLATRAVILLKPVNTLHR